MLQDRIIKNAQYFKGIEMMGQYPILKVSYPPKWGVFPSENDTIKVAKSEDTPNEWFYYTTLESVTLDDMFDLMENTIKVNLSAIAKIELLKLKIEELKVLFSNESLERLQTLQFTITDENEKKPKKQKRKKKVEVVEETIDNEETNVEVEEVKETCLS